MRLGRDTVTLRANGRDYSGWRDGVVVTASLEEASRSFAFVAAEKYPAHHPYQLRPDDAVEILFDGDHVCTGYVDRIQLDDDATQIAGSSKTRDVVDCSAKLGTIRNKTLLQLANQLGAPHGVEAVEDGVTTRVISRHRTAPGAKIYEVLEKYARQQATLITDDAQGRIVFTRPGARKADTEIRRPGNVLLGSSVVFDSSERYSTYEVRGQRAGDDDTHGDAVSSRAVATDDVPQHNRYLYITDRVSGGAPGRKDRAIWEAATRAGKSVEATYQLAGWRQWPGGPLWEPGLLVPVTDIARGFDGDQLLIVGCTYSLAGPPEGARVTLLLRPLAGYQLLEPRRATSSSKGTGSASGRWKELDNVTITPPTKVTE